MTTSTEDKRDSRTLVLLDEIKWHRICFVGQQNWQWLILRGVMRWREWMSLTSSHGWWRWCAPGWRERGSRTRRSGPSCRNVVASLSTLQPRMWRFHGDVFRRRSASDVRARSAKLSNRFDYSPEIDFLSYLFCTHTFSHARTLSRSRSAFLRSWWEFRKPCGSNSGFEKKKEKIFFRAKRKKNRLVPLQSRCSAGLTTHFDTISFSGTHLLTLTLSHTHALSHAPAFFGSFLLTRILSLSLFLSRAHSSGWLKNNSA